MAEEFKISRENELLATPEQVWDAVTTGPSAWLAPMKIDPKVGGAVSHGPSTVTIWDPPWRFACRHENKNKGLSHVVEHLIEARDDDTTILRTLICRAYSGIVPDDWETQTDVADKRSTFYLHTLGQYLQYFRGHPVTFVRAYGPPAAARANAFMVLRRELGLTDDVAEGDAVRLALAGLDPLDAVVDYLSPHFICLRTADGLYRFFGNHAWGMPIFVTLHLFAKDIDQNKTTQAWRLWLSAVFAQ
jgi:hypothetical protein